MAILDRPAVTRQRRAADTLILVMIEDRDALIADLFLDQLAEPSGQASSTQ